MLQLAQELGKISKACRLKSLQVVLLAANAVTEMSALAGLDSLQSVDLTGNPLSEAARAQVGASASPA